jgi:hypothetical protein
MSSLVLFVNLTAATGHIPTEIGQLSQLIDLHLWRNKLTGTWLSDNHQVQEDMNIPLTISGVSNASQDASQAR